MGNSDTKLSLENIANRSYDPVLDLQLVEIAEVSPSGNAAYRKVTSDLATRIVIDGTDIYIGKAAVGTAVGSATWQVKKIDTASDIIITWADSNANFDNVFTNPTALTYG